MRRLPTAGIHARRRDLWRCWVRFHSVPDRLVCARKIHAEQTARPCPSVRPCGWPGRTSHFATRLGIYMFNWSAVDMIVITFPYFLLYWVAQGDLLAKITILGIDLALESAFFGILMLVCILFVPFWLWLSRTRNKREAYMLGMFLCGSSCR